MPNRTLLICAGLGLLVIGAILGGEQSGHVIFHDQATTGDGILTMLRLLAIVAREKTSLDDLAAELERRLAAPWQTPKLQR